MQQYSKLSDFVGNRSVVIVGFGVEGHAMARVLCTHTRADITVVARSIPENTVNDIPVPVVTGDAYLEPLRSADIIVRSPGVPPHLPALLDAKKRGVVITSATKLFFDACPAPIIGITGSNGKTTTTNLIAHLLAAADRTVWRGGNDGIPLISRLDSIGPDDAVVLELSSFQLCDLDRSPHIAVVTNIAPNHLDYHASLDDYIAAKKNIIRFQSHGDYALLNARDPHVSLFGSRGTRVALLSRQHNPCTWRDRDRIHVRLNAAEATVSVVDIPFITADENLCAAIATAVISNVGHKFIERALSTFTPPHERLEQVAHRNGIIFINDSASTTPDSTIFAIRSFPAGHLVLIAGGRNKGMEFSRLAEAIIHTRTRVVLIGEAAQEIHRAIRSREPALETYTAETLDTAITQAVRIAAPEDIVLFSPACASFDMFANAKERGREFTRIITGMSAETDSQGNV